MIPTAGGNTFCIFIFPPSFKPDLLPLEWPPQAPASGWKGGVHGFLFLFPSRPIPSHPFPVPSSGVQITWLGEAEGKGVSNAKCLERTVSIACMIPVSGRSKAQGREEEKEKFPVSREMLMPQTSLLNGKDTYVSWKMEEAAGLPPGALRWNLETISQLEGCQIFSRLTAALSSPRFKLGRTISLRTHSQKGIRAEMQALGSTLCSVKYLGDKGW